MAGDVTLALDEMLAPQNLSVAMLKKAVTCLGTFGPVKT
jgi:hypothetical protein